MNRREELLEFLDKIYIPVDKLNDVAILTRIVLENDYRAISEEDANTMKTDCLVIHTKGRGLRETFAGFSITRIDIASVSESMATIAIYNQDSNRFEPQRIKRMNKRINILE